VNVLLSCETVSYFNNFAIVLSSPSPLVLFGQLPSPVALYMHSRNLAGGLRQNSMPQDLTTEPLLLELEIYGSVLILTRSIQEDEGVRGHVLWNEEDKISCFPCRTARNIYSATK